MVTRSTSSAASTSSGSASQQTATSSRKQKVKKTGAWLVRYALEQLGIRHTFGIPGVHNTEIYDELNKSTSITPMLVTHEGGGAFMADAISRTSDSVGTLLVVPAAGITHAASGIAEAHLDGVPMLVISGGIRTDGMAYQLHDMDQHALMAPITKATYKVERHADIVETLYRAYCLAVEGEPGPVFVEVPVDIALFRGETAQPPKFEFERYAQQLPQQQRLPQQLDDAELARALELIKSSGQVGIFAGWGARDASAELVALADQLAAPVSTTLQGLSVFPASHGLHVGMGFGKYSVPAAEKAFEQVDCVIAIGTRFSEIPTGSFGMTVPEKLIHIDINPEVFSANYPATVALHCDASIALKALLAGLEAETARNAGNMVSLIHKEKGAYQQEWFKADKDDKVNPARFFTALRQNLDDDDFLVVDDGNHTFLTAELMPVQRSRHFISPTDFNCMGYCVPAAIGTKLMHQDKTVVGIVGDGAFMMTCMELITASRNQLGVVMVVFNDGELAQISQAQAVPYNRKTCTQLSGLKVEGVALATGAEYLRMEHNSDIEPQLEQALAHSAQGRPVIIDVNIDYSKKTRFTKGIVKTNLQRFELKEQVRFIGRAIKRRVIG